MAYTSHCYVELNLLDSYTFNGIVSIIALGNNSYREELGGEIRKQLIEGQASWDYPRGNTEEHIDRHGLASHVRQSQSGLYN